MYEFFRIRYSAPCWTTYLKYKTVNYKTNIVDRKHETEMHSSKSVNNIVYDEVMELVEYKESAHYRILASKNDGILQIFDQDNNVNWILN